MEACSDCQFATALKVHASAAGALLTIESVPLEVRHSKDAGPRSNLKETRDSAESDDILRALEDSNWNVSAAARVLAMERTNLHKRIRALGLFRGR